MTDKGNDSKLPLGSTPYSNRFFNFNSSDFAPTPPVDRKRGEVKLEENRLFHLSDILLTPQRGPTESQRPKLGTDLLHDLDEYRLSPFFKGLEQSSRKRSSELMSTPFRADDSMQKFFLELKNPQEEELGFLNSSKSTFQSFGHSANTLKTSVVENTREHKAPPIMPHYSEMPPYGYLPPPGPPGFIPYVGAPQFIPIPHPVYQPMEMQVSTPVKSVVDLPLTILASSTKKLQAMSQRKEYLTSPTPIIKQRRDIQGPAPSMGTFGRKRRFPEPIEEKPPQNNLQFVFTDVSMFQNRPPAKKKKCVKRSSTFTGNKENIHPSGIEEQKQRAQSSNGLREVKLENTQVPPLKLNRAKVMARAKSLMKASSLPEFGRPL